MFAVSYQFQFEYSYDMSGKLFPRLEFRVSSPENTAKTIDVQTYLDCGTERSLLNGWIGTALGLDILGGQPILYKTGAGTLLQATTHAVRFFHPDLGDLDLEVGFSSSDIPRNLLGRDFFDLFQIGFREHYAMFFLTASP